MSQLFAATKLAISVSNKKKIHRTARKCALLSAVGLSIIKGRPMIYYIMKSPAKDNLTVILSRVGSC